MDVLGLFPGQGSQRVGMGQSFADSIDHARMRFEEADRALDFSLSEICFRGPSEELTSTAIGQPAILTVSIIAFELFVERFKDQVKIVVAAGHSLGEYSALVAAGALKFSDAVLLVHKRGKYMQEAVPHGCGGMVAVLGVDEQELQELCQSCSEPVEVANVNAPGQIVVSGATGGLAELKERLKGKKTVDLAVSAPFHSSLMAPAAEKLAVDLDQLPIAHADFPVISNVTADVVQEPEEIRSALKAQVCSRVRWVESMERALQHHSINSAVEFGEGAVLSGLLKRIDKSVPKKAISTPEDLNGF